MQWLRAAVPCVPIALAAHHFLGGVTIVRARSSEIQEAHSDHVAEQQEDSGGRSGGFPRWPEAVVYESVSTRRCRFVKQCEVHTQREGGVGLANLHSRASLRAFLFDPINQEHRYIQGTKM